MCRFVHCATLGGAQLLVTYANKIILKVLSHITHFIHTSCKFFSQLIASVEECKYMCYIICISLLATIHYCVFILFHI